MHEYDHALLLFWYTLFDKVKYIWKELRTSETTRKGEYKTNNVDSIFNRMYLMIRKYKNEKLNTYSNLPSFLRFEQNNTLLLTDQLNNLPVAISDLISNGEKLGLIAYI